MAQRRPPYRSPPTSPLTRGSHYKRRSLYSKRRVVGFNRILDPTAISHGRSASTHPRPVLVPLHLNLRRLPSRARFLKEESMPIATRKHDVQVGSKRKRVGSVNENVYNGGRPTKGPGSYKRQRSTRKYASSDEGEVITSSMDVDDDPGQWTSEEEGDVEQCQSRILS